MTYECQLGPQCTLPLEGTTTSISYHLRIHDHFHKQFELVHCPWAGCADGMLWRNVVRHVKEKHLGMKVQCETCGKRYTRKGSLKVHVQKCHSRCAPSCGLLCRSYNNRLLPSRVSVSHEDGLQRTGVGMHCSVNGGPLTGRGGGDALCSPEPSKVWTSSSLWTCISQMHTAFGNSTFDSSTLLIFSCYAPSSYLAKIQTLCVFHNSTGL
ncbi:hypothetical protein EDC04DRAFT_2775510 [Pisolithus marmoratus]|nr:hypothetical protein EDC04DRAFT_2775510 [Pisolithus marmoratus]